MCKLIENYEVYRRIRKYDYIKFSPAGTSTKNTALSQMFIIIHREVSVISLINRYIELKFVVITETNISRYVNGDDIRLSYLGSIAIFSNYKLTTSSDKHLEDISHTHIVCFWYKLIKSRRSSDDLSVGFDRDRVRRQQQIIKKT